MDIQNKEMENGTVQPGETQANFVKEDLNFNIDPNDPITKASLNEHPVEEWTDILGNGNLKKKVVKQGKSGTRPYRFDICTLNIVGKLEDGTVVEENEDLKIQLGDVEVILGLDLVITLMDVGEVAEVVVDPRLAYGHTGNLSTIPPDATIFYTVELKSVETEEEIETLNIHKRKEIGNKKRERGNWWFERDSPMLAIQCYRRALEFLIPAENRSSYQMEADESATDAELQALLEDSMKVYNNLAAAQMKTQAYDAALKNVESVLSCQPQNVKALFRKGKILHYKGEHTAAYNVLLQAAKLEPKMKAIQVELATLKKKIVKDIQYEKDLYRKMFATHKNVEPLKDKEVKRKKRSNLLWSVIGGTTAVIAGYYIHNCFIKRC